MVHAMNKTSSNPFTGLKGALAGLMSGGWMGLLLGLLFRRRIAPMLAALEGLFAQWQAGTLPIAVAVVPVRTMRQAVAPRVPCGPRRAPVSRCRVRAARGTAVVQAAAPRLRVAVWSGVRAELRLALARCAPRPACRRGRCRKKIGWVGKLPHGLIVTIS
jgi:hypothetical protein